MFSIALTTTSHVLLSSDLLVHVVCEAVLQHPCEGRLFLRVNVHTHDLTHLAAETTI